MHPHCIDYQCNTHPYTLTSDIFYCGIHDIVVILQQDLTHQMFGAVMVGEFSAG